MSKTKVVRVLLAVGLTTVLLCVLFLRFGALPSLSFSSVFDEPVPTGYDPLTATEVKGVVTAALQTAGADSVRATASGEQEVLLVERHEASKAEYASGKWPRQGDVYLYDYGTDTLVHTVVNVQSSTVVTVERVQGVQLPLTVREEQRALALIQADATLWARLADRYQTITGEQLARLEQLQVKVSVFHADAMPDQVNAAAKLCGRHRCAQALIFTVDKTLLEFMPIVDLFRGKVVQTLVD